MRLLHCTQTPEDGHISVSFEEYEDYLPEYAILSHRWGPTEDEVSFNDICSGSAGSKRGWAKIRGCCAQALEDDIHYVWIDSCCIDKGSSAELTEAINSMYRYYANATICYAYLEDVQDKEDPHDRDSTFRQSVWFYRGWTLQELIAPGAVLFLSKSWIELGTKDTLADVVEKITGIEMKYLTGHPISDASIAQRMSWAAHRQTTRIEDRAYSLMGLFGVHMPAIYGEGRKAFIRLQLEIIKTSDDQSIFAWDDQDLSSTDCGMLSDDPWYFRYGSKIVRLEQNAMIQTYGNPQDPRTTPLRLHYELTNFGLHIWLLVQRGFRTDHSKTPVIQAILACSDPHQQPSFPPSPFRMTLAPVQRDTVISRYKRISSNTVLEPDVGGGQSSLRYEELFILSFVDHSKIYLRPSDENPPVEFLEVDFRALSGFVLIGAYPPIISSTQSSIVVPAGYKQGFTVQLWNSRTAEMIVVQGNEDSRGPSLDMNVTTSSQPLRAEGLHKYLDECLGRLERPSGNLWFRQMDLPISKGVVILSANLIRYQLQPGEHVRLSCQKRLRIKLKIV